MERIVIVLTSLLVFGLFITIDAQTNYQNYGCVGSDFNYTKGSFFEDNLNQLLSQLTTKSNSLKFYNYTFGNDPNKVYGLFQCRNDLSLTVCNACVKDATQKVTEECPLSGEGIVWYQECMLRYANRNIFSNQETLPGARTWSRTNVTNYAEFAPILANALNEVIKKATSASSHFASGESNLTLFDQLYTFAQCTPDIDASGCNICLKNAMSVMAQCCSASVKVLVFKPSCQLWYDTSPFLKDQSPPAPPPDSNTSSGLSGTTKKTTIKPAILGAIAACVLVGLLVLSIVLWICLCRKKPVEASRDIPVASSTGQSVGPGGPYGNVKSEVESFRGSEFEQYDFDTLKTATRGFSAETKLGQGGFGIVYKGTLENGHQLAIKRLSAETSGQGTKEFMTEARLLAKLQHKNLVKLVGFCSEGDEKLLVYEFMPNGSLDMLLFDPIKRPTLDWVTRSKIILGIARGLQYLHEDSRLTIIHRDLKPGNILLDKEMNPKVADFGLAKLFEVAQKFGSTARIVGTQGYMAPEYLMTGAYSDKSDVYSFGIMLLEIVSGQKNRTIRQSPPKEDLSLQAWRLWNEERSYEIIDPIVLNNCSSNEVMRCIQIGLLCIQADAEQRPSMTTVVLMLTGSVDLPLPSAPTMPPSNQHSVPMNYSSGQQSDPDQSVTLATDMGQDLYPRPR